MVVASAAGAALALAVAGCNPAQEYRYYSDGIGTDLASPTIVTDSLPSDAWVRIRHISEPGRFRRRQRIYSEHRFRCPIGAVSIRVAAVWGEIEIVHTHDMPAVPSM